MKERLARLEASLAKNKGQFKRLFSLLIRWYLGSSSLISSLCKWCSLESGNEEQLKLVGELQSQLEEAKAEQIAERDKVSVLP